MCVITYIMRTDHGYLRSGKIYTDACRPRDLDRKVAELTAMGARILSVC